jgi:aminopeptidase N
MDGPGRLLQAGGLAHRAGALLQGIHTRHPRFKTNGVDATISINDKPTEVVNLKSGKFTLTRLIKDSSDVTSIAVHFSDAQIYQTERDNREVSAFVDEISINDIPDFASFRDIANDAGEKSLRSPG